MALTGQTTLSDRFRRAGFRDDDALQEVIPRRSPSSCSSAPVDCSPVGSRSDTAHWNEDSDDAFGTRIRNIAEKTRNRRTMDGHC